MVAAAPLLGAARDLHGQTFHGRVVEEGADRPVAGALVHLLDPDGDPRAFALSDSTGRYVLSAPAPGVFRLRAEGLGYEGLQSPLLETTNPEGSYPVDLVVRRAPIPIRGLDVTADRVERQIRLMIGVSPRSLRVAPIPRAEIESHLEKGHQLGDLLRWQNLPSLLVFRTVDGPCFTLRGSGCIPVYLNGVRIRTEFLDALPLDIADAVVVLYPHETIVYEGGAVLLYTEAWLR